MRTKLLLFSMLITVSIVHAEPARRTIFNDDGQVIGEAPAEGTVEFIESWLDRESGFVPFTTFVFLAATPDICLYDTNVGERYGARFGEDFNEGWVEGMRALRALGTDPLRLVSEYMSGKGYEVLAAVRMNDTHHRSLDPENPGCPQFTLDHPEYVIEQPDGRDNETALDYSYPEVRAHRLAIMREIAEEYPVDGLELNFVRWAKHFPRHLGREKAPIFTHYMTEIRAMLDEAAKKRSVERLTLGVRVPESLQACWLAGIDIKTWVERGLVDFIVAATWNNTDPQLPVEEFTSFARPAGVQTLVLMGNMIGAIWDGPPIMYDRGIAISAKHSPTYNGMLITEAEARAAAANYYAWGADGISFWNVGIHFGGEKTATPEQQQRIEQWTHAVLEPDRVLDGPRWYHYIPMGKGMSARKPPARNYPWADEGHSPLGQPNSPTLEFTAENAGKRLVFPFRMADGRNGEKLHGTLEFRVYHVTEKDTVSIDLNGVNIPGARVSRRPVDPRAQLPGTRYSVKLQDCPPFQGNNELGLRLTKESSGGETPIMEELEIFVAP